ncbi:multiple sugar transport system substrate-binding protein [Paenibacillus endophyticus]|uniref:Multiple sugar transport system substrate-binding protein n=1 Tax=Paenibacillus endophyticus TaxID=1294268 RepID=A0A7W5GDN6_9BACL|nr:sugar ABC transporter substrate-binding protein [Paenibacillus endophyticus]MBB3155262.1 multiple sugar transport system substrate-binding protein [Paenibacillus endophyticus]
MKKWVGFSLSLVLLASMLAGCAANKTSEGNHNKKADGEKVSLKFSIWGNDTHKQMYDAMIEKYKVDHPNIDVEIMTIPATDYQQKLSVMMASKTSPDVMWMMERAIPQFLGAGQLADLSSLKSDAAYKFDDLYPSTLDLLTKDGSIYGIPFSTPPNMIYYNQSLFESKGLKTPKELYGEGKWTYDEMVKAAEAIAEPEQGLFGVNLIRPNGWTTSWIESLQTLVWAFDADYFSEDGKTFTLNSKEGEQAIQFFSDAMFKSRIHPKPGDQTTFETGKIAMQQELFSYMGKAKAITDFKWDIAPMPSGAGGQGVTLGYAGYVVTEGSPHQAEAIELVKYLTNQENMAITSQFFVPSRQSVLESETFLNQGPSPESVKTAVLEQIAKGKVRQAFTNFQKIDEKMKIGFDSIYTQSATVSEFLKSLEKDITPVLNP